MPYLSQPADRALYAIEDDEELGSAGYASSNTPNARSPSPLPIQPTTTSVPHYSYRPDIMDHPLPAPVPAPSAQRPTTSTVAASAAAAHHGTPLALSAASPSPPLPVVAGLPASIPGLRDRVARDDLQAEDEDEADEEGDTTTAAAAAAAAGTTPGQEGERGSDSSSASLSSDFDEETSSSSSNEDDIVIIDDVAPQQKLQTPHTKQSKRKQHKSKQQRDQSQPTPLSSHATTHSEATLEHPLQTTAAGGRTRQDPVAPSSRPAK